MPCSKDAPVPSMTPALLSHVSTGGTQFGRSCTLLDEDVHFAVASFLNRPSKALPAFNQFEITQDLRGDPRTNRK
jgi:hypothetical protein